MPEPAFTWTKVDHLAKKPFRCSDETDPKLETAHCAESSTLMTLYLVSAHHCLHFIWKKEYDKRCYSQTF